ncbi:Diaminohydroxyphosphoribosylamino-pyrimidine deaminase [Colletotrichum sp. SAR 10_77]|nr:Diaminohydroxyphosphoribosylamino-pyrimidine deaminase [Colletotrichum sp. SAR 10_77]
MAVKALISTLEDEILDPEEGFIDPKATTLSLTLADRDFTIHQSPTVLSSTRAGGTTGAGSPSTRSFDAVVCCDCIYNEALVDPLVSTTADLARLRLRIQEEEEETDAEEAERSEPCVCIVAQQLRSPDVFEEWAKSFHKQFRMWRVPDELLPEGLRIESGFVVHVGILRESKFEP